MDFINEEYHANYEPKLDIDDYCYYADETNRNIMIEIISDYRKKALGESGNDCHEGLERFKNRLNMGPVFVFFERNRVAYNNLSAYPTIEETYAAEMNYKVVKVNYRSVITIE